MSASGSSLKGDRYFQVTSISIPLAAPIRHDLALRYFNRSPDEILDLVRDERHYRVLPGAPDPLLIEVSAPREQLNGASLIARVLAGVGDEEAIRAAVLRLYQPSPNGVAHVHDEPLAVKVTENFKGLPVLQTLTPWEALVWAILGQQITIGFAYRLKRAFTEQFGERLIHDGQAYYAFPTPERVAELDHERDLRPLQFSRQKSRYIIEAARSVLTGELDFSEIAMLDDAAASAALQRQLGVGRWTAEYVLLRGFGRLDVIPAGDVALRMIVGKYLELGRHASEDEVRELAERWRPRRGEIGFMLWFAKQSGWFRK